MNVKLKFRFHLVTSYYYYSGIIGAVIISRELEVTEVVNHGLLVVHCSLLFYCGL